MRAEVIYFDDQATTADYADVGNPVDTLEWQCISFTVANLTTSAQMYYKVLGANQKNFSDSQVVQAEATLTISSGATPVGGYSTSLAVWRYYKVQIKLIGQATTARVTAVVKG
jgi:hypothetical protein